MSDAETEVLVALANYVQANGVFPKRDRFAADQSSRIAAFDALERKRILERWYGGHIVWAIPALERIAHNVPFAAEEIRRARAVFHELKRMYDENLDSVHELRELQQRLKIYSEDELRRALISVRNGIFHQLRVLVPGMRDTFGLTEQILRVEWEAPFDDPPSRAKPKNGPPPSPAPPASTPALESTFISYGGPDEVFARKLNKALKRRGVKTFFFKDDALPGEKLHRVMRKGVNEHDRVILICSKSSLQRPGLLNELEETLAREARDGGRTYLLPIRLDDYVLAEWNPADSNTSRAVRDRVVADFSKHEDPKEFNEAVTKLVAALKQTS